MITRYPKKKAKPKEHRSDLHSTYYYKGKPYKILYKSKLKLDGEWIPCVIYKCLYKNPDGLIWVRKQEEFFELFSINKPDKEDWIEL
jgi:hypothetical protein